MEAWRFNMNNKERVVITGLGGVSPVGHDPDTIWEHIKTGVSGIGPITRFDTTDHSTFLAAEVKNLDTHAYIDPKEARKLDLFVQYALIAAKKAACDAGLEALADHPHVDPFRVGVIIGSGIGGLATMVDNSLKLTQKGPGRVSPHFIPMTLVNIAAGNVAIALGAGAICTSVVTACAAGTDSIGQGFREIADGRADIIFAGGTEASLTPLGVAGFSVMKATSSATDPARASIPFDAERNGFVMGEGAGMLVLEGLTSAKKRGATIYAEVVGYGASCDAYHITAPMPGGAGASRAMAAALAEAGLAPTAIDYINAHGTSTPLNDATETAAVKATFGDHAYQLALSSTKSMTGHLLGASGAIEALITVKALQAGFIPPTAGYQVPDPACDLDIVPNQGRAAALTYAMSNSFGFGGHNASLVFKKWTA